MRATIIAIAEATNLCLYCRDEVRDFRLVIAAERTLDRLREAVDEIQETRYRRGGGKMAWFCQIYADEGHHGKRKECKGCPHNSITGLPEVWKE